MEITLGHTYRWYATTENQYMINEIPHSSKLEI